MDDLKIVLYLVAAIGWVIYNNFRKITAENRKRDSKRPPVSESPTENWPSWPEAPKPAKEVVKMPEPRIKKVEPVKKPVVKSRPVRVPVPDPVPVPVLAVAEGGNIKPSSRVVFEMAHENVAEHEHPWLAEFRSGTDWRKMLVATEILQRPVH
jgi:hypothetical protein